MFLLLCVALSALGLLVTGVQIRRRRARAATRWLALALLPAGAYLTGLLTLGTRVVDAVVRWATSLTFNPMTWAGLVLLAVAAVLLVAAGLAPRSSGRKPGGGPGGPERPLRDRPASGPAGRARRAGLPGRAHTTAAPGPADDDFAEIEEILRRRGI